MAKKDFTFVSKLLLYFLAADELLTPWLSVYEIRRRALFGNYNTYRANLRRFYQRGWIKIIDRDAQKFIQLTKRGELEALMAKARLPQPERWDGKWRLVVFDIPEEVKRKRAFLRELLKKNNFFKLQASVYVNPYPLNREAVKYLKQSGLMQFIRIIKAEEMDDDGDLRKKFKLRQTE